MKKTDKRKFAFIINYGIEYRNFFISNLSNKLLENHDIVVIKKDIKNNLFDMYEKNYDFKTINLEKKYFKKQRLKIENIFQSVRKSRMKLKGFGVFKNYNLKSNSLSFKDIIKGNLLSYSFFRFMTLKYINNNYQDKSIKKILLENNITDIILSGYSSTSSISFAINSLSLNLNVWTFINSWKDFYINDFLPFKSSAFFMWSDSMKSDYIVMNKHIKSDTMISTGNAIFDRFYNAKPTNNIEYYEKKYKIKKDQKILLYSMLDPDRYKKESEIISLIYKEIEKKYDNIPILLIKKNPFDSTNNVDNYFKDFKDIVVLEHFSQRDKENDFFIQSIDGEKEWIDLLYYSDVILGAASTIALEAIMMKKPIITISFDEKNNFSNFLFDLAEASFYKKLLERKDVSISKNIKDFAEILNYYIYEFKNSENKIPEILGIFDGKATEKILKEIYNA